jgi:hypothetical protein
MECFLHETGSDEKYDPTEHTICAECTRKLADIAGWDGITLQTEDGEVLSVAVVAVRINAS